MTIDGASYALDNAGNRTAKTDQRTAVATSYGYDNIYQLLSATQGATTTESYTYDPVGNRTASLGVSSYTTNSSNEMTANSNASYTYDYNGNTLTKTDSSGTTTYAWDFENRMTSVTLPGSGGTVSFKYDPLGRRNFKSSAAGTSVYAFDGENLIEETNSSGSVTARYSQGLNIDEPLAMLRSSTTSYYHSDGLGSVTSMSSGAGALVQTYSYESFGKQTTSSGSLINPFLYAGREFDSESSLYYMRSRYFDPSSGRFLSEDPIQFVGGVNFFAYVKNRPVGYIDPSGLTKFNYDVTRKNDGSWDLGGEGQFNVDLPPKVTYDCHCVGNGQYKLQISVTWYIRIFYGSQRQLKHENGHLEILQKHYDSRKSYYEQKYETVYASEEACDKASWDVRRQVIGDLVQDYAAQGKLQNAHDDWFERIWQWWPWHH